MKKLLVLGAADFQIPLITEAAENCELYVVAPVISDKVKSMCAGVMYCDVKDKESVLKYAKEINIDGIITDQTDIAVRTVAYVAEKMGLPGNGIDCGNLFTSKSLMREKLIELGIPVLPHAVVKTEKEAIEFFEKYNVSMILKPTDNQGSRGVQKVCSVEEIKQKFAESVSCSGTGEVIIEKFICGKELVVEGIVFDYEYKTLICGDTHYFDIPDAFAAKSRVFPSEESDEIVNKTLALNERIITGFGLKQGITHSEFIVDGEDVYLIETAARGGGVFISSDIISELTGLNTERFLINIALGLQETMPSFESTGKVCAYQAFYVPAGVVREVNGVEKVSGLSYVRRNQLEKIKPGFKVEKNTDKTSRLAIIVSADSYRQLDERKECIKQLLDVKSETENGISGLIWD